MKVKKFMRHAPAQVNMTFHSVTGESGPNTRYTKEELAFAAAVQIELLGAQLNLAVAMLEATAPQVLPVGHALARIAQELKSIGQAAREQTAPAARHEARVFGSN